MTADIVAAALAGLGPMIQQGSRKPVNRFAARREFGDALLMQGAKSTPLQGGVVEGLARAGQAALGGWMANKAEKDEIADEDKKSQGLIRAISSAQRTNPDGTTSFDFSPVAQALAASGQGGTAAYMMLMDQLARRQLGQAAATTQLITGQAPPGAGGGTYDQRVSLTESPNGATNPQSGASGFFQFMPRTAIGLAKQTAWGASMTPEQIVAVIRDPNRRAEQQELMKLYTAQSDAALTQAGIPINDATRFALHAFGPSGGVSLLRAPDNMPVAQWVQSVNWGEASPQQVIAQNRLDKYQTVGQLRQDFIARRIGGGPGTPVGPGTPGAPTQIGTAAPGAATTGMQPQPRPVQLAAAPPVEGGGVDDSGQDRGMSPGFAPSAAPPLTITDDGSREMAIYNRWLANPNPQQQEIALKFYQLAQEKMAKAAQRRDDQTFKPSPEFLGADRTIQVVTGGQFDPERIEREKAAATRGGGQYGPPEMVAGNPMVRNTVTGKPDALPMGDKLREFDQGAREAIDVTSRFLEVFKDREAINAYLNNPQSPNAARVNQAFENMKIIMRSPSLYNTGVLQPGESRMIDAALSSPQSIRGLLASPEAMQAKIEEIQRLVHTRRNAAFASAGMAPPELPKSGGQGGADPLSQARDAIAKGAPRDKVVERLRAMGVDPGGL